MSVCVCVCESRMPAVECARTRVEEDVCVPLSGLEQHS